MADVFLLFFFFQKNEFHSFFFFIKIRVSFVKSFFSGESLIE